LVGVDWNRTCINAPFLIILDDLASIWKTLVVARRRYRHW
jgi:hypothetical protein